MRPPVPRSRLAARRRSPRHRRISKSVASVGINNKVWLIRGGTHLGIQNSRPAATSILLARSTVSSRSTHGISGRSRNWMSWNLLFE